MSHGDPTPLLQRRNDYTNKSIHLIFVVKRERTHKRITARSRIFLYFHSPHHQRNAFASASSFVFGGKTLEARNNNSTTASAAATNRFVSLVPFIAFYFHSVGWTIERCHIHSLWSGIELREYKHWLPLFRSLFHCRPLPAVPAATCNRCVCVCVSLIFAKYEDGKMVMASRYTTDRDGTKKSERDLHTHFTRNVENTS